MKKKDINCSIEDTLVKLLTHPQLDSLVINEESMFPEIEDLAKAIVKRLYRMKRRNWKSCDFTVG